MQAAPIKLGKLNFSSDYSLNWSLDQCLRYLYFKNDTQSILCHWEKAYFEKKMGFKKQNPKNNTSHAQKTQSGELAKIALINSGPDGKQLDSWLQLYSSGTHSLPSTFQTFHTH